MRGRAASAVALAFAFACLAPLPAGAAVLLGVRATLQAGQAPRIVLTFDSGVPAYRVYGEGTSDVVLLLSGTTRARNAAATLDGKNSLRGISLDTVGDGTEVTFHDASPARLSVATGGGQSLVVTLRETAPPSDANDSFGATRAATPAAPAAAPAGAEMEVVPLKYADLSEVVGLLVPGTQIAPNDSFVPAQQNFGASGGGFGAAGIGSPLGGSTQAAQLTTGGAGTFGQTISDAIGIDRRLNAIVLTGSRATIDALRAKIDKLDVPLPLVLLETQIVELTDSAAADLGIDFTNAGGPIASGTYQIKNLTTGQGVANLQAAVYAQIQAGRGRTIARPRIVAQNGNPAQIVTGDALPIVTAIAVSGVNAVSQQVQYVNVGVNLQIQPRIASDGYVTSHIFSEVSSVTGYQQGYPTLSQREATTSLTVRDGESFVIGGLLQRNELNSMSKLPGIGDLPLIGGLFRVKHAQSNSTNLYIIVTPHVLANGNAPPPNLPVLEPPPRTSQRSMPSAVAPPAVATPAPAPFPDARRATAATWPLMSARPGLWAPATTALEASVAPWRAFAAKDRARATVTLRR